MPARTARDSRFPAGAHDEQTARSLLMKSRVVATGRIARARRRSMT